jgi:DDE superfamily endonuclease
VAKLFAQRTKREYALFLQALAVRYPEAEKIRLVQDNLNTHCLSALYGAFPAEQAFALAQRFEFFFTPKSASWLNMIEIEFSALARECLHRRMPTFEVMEREILTLVEERSTKAIKIDWQFSISAARDKFSRHYRRLREEQSLYYDI